MALTVTPSPVLYSPSHTTLGTAPKFGVSATLAANEIMEGRRRRGEPVLPMGFGEAGLPVHPALRDALATAADRNAYGPVAGSTALREAAASYWARRGLPTEPGTVVCGPGSKALLYGLVAAIGGDLAVTKPSWVSYAAQASLAGMTAHLVPGHGGVPDAAELSRTAAAARVEGRPIRAVIVTLPDNPTGALATSSAVRALCAVAEQYDLIIISDEIYRDLVYDDEPEFAVVPPGGDGALSLGGLRPPAPPGAAPRFESPATFSPERTVVTTGLSKNLALGGWRLGVVRTPGGRLGHELRGRLLAIGSEIWSAPANPVQHAAALAFTEPPELTDHIAGSRRLHAAVARAVARSFAAAGAKVAMPRAAFYVYPDFGPLADVLLERHGITSDEGLTQLLLHRYGVGVLPASAFGEQDWRLRLRVATGMLYGETPAQRSTALSAADPCSLPWIAAALTRLDEVLADIAN